jgi:hypothetical protein
VNAATLLQDNIGSISSTGEALLGRVVLVCGLRQGQPAAGSAGGGRPAGRPAAAPRVEAPPQKPVVSSGRSLTKPISVQESGAMG